jgi:hypothetical protein
MARQIFPYPGPLQNFKYINNEQGFAVKSEPPIMNIVFSKAMPTNSIGRH